MAGKGFAAADNPFEGVHPRFALEWQVGYASATIAKALTGPWADRTDAFALNTKKLRTVRA
jgi:hypothetical protein